MRIVIFNFLKAFKSDKGVKNISLKILTVLVFGPIYIGLFILMFTALILNRWVNILMKTATTALITIFKETEGVRKLILMLVLGVILVPLIFLLYLSVIVIRLVFYVGGILYNIFHFIMTLTNQEIIQNKMDSYIKINQEKDVF